MNCTKCGAAVAEGSMYCNHCGRKAISRDVHPKAKIILVSVLLITYGFAVLTCFIVNLGVSGLLSWFYIVLCGVALLFCATVLPLLLPKGRLPISGLATSGMVYLLLYACSALVNGDWLLSFAYPVATFGLLAAWLIVFICMIRTNWFIKSTLIALIVMVLAITINSFTDYVFSGIPFDINIFFNNTWTSSNIGNKATAWCLILYSCTALGIGIVKEIAKRTKQN